MAKSTFAALVRDSGNSELVLLHCLLINNWILQPKKFLTLVVLNSLLMNAHTCPTEALGRISLLKSLQESATKARDRLGELPSRVRSTHVL